MSYTLTRMSTNRRIIIATPRGCYADVDRAVTTMGKTIETYDSPVYMHKQIVRNKYIVSVLEKRSATLVDELGEAPADALMVFSAHDVSPAVHEEMARREPHTVDAACPLVTRVHRETKRFAVKETDALLIGHAGHGEVEGTMEEAPNRTTPLGDPDDVNRLDLPTDKLLVWSSQTTLSVDETMKTVTRLWWRSPLLVNPPTNDICYATQDRQQMVRQTTPHCDLMIAAGSQNSSNSMCLAEIAPEAGAKHSERTDHPHGIRDEWFDGISTIGLTPRVSMPGGLVQGVLALLRERDFPKVDEEHLTEGNLTFVLPPELCRNLSGEDQRRSHHHPGRRGDGATKRHGPLDVGAD